MRLVRLLLSASKGGVALAVLFGLLSGASLTALLSLIIRTVGGQGGTTAREGWTFAAVGLLALLTRVASQMVSHRLQYGVITQLRMRLCRQLMLAPLRALEERGSHRLLAVLTEDVAAVNMTLVMLPTLIINVFIVVGSLVYLTFLSGWVMPWLVGFIVLGYLTYQMPTMRALALAVKSRHLHDSMYEHFRAITEGIKEFKLHDRRRDAFLEEELLQTASSLKVAQTRTSDIFAAAASWGLFLFFVFIGTLLFVVPHITSVSHEAVVGYTLVILYLQQPLQNIMDCTPNLNRGAVALNQIEALGVSLMQAHEPAHTPLLAEPRSFSSVELVGVTHSYLREREDSHFTVGPVDLTLVPGEIVFLVGGNGSGKTTLAKVMTGLYAPESGELRLDGEKVAPEALGRYRQLFGAVFSDFYLFERLMGLGDEPPGPRAKPYLDKLQLAHKVTLQGDRLSTTRLSQGQRKRLALLTAYLEDRPIYLFDEWAADQDPEFKEVFYRQLLPELKQRGKTVIVISHDDAYFGVADRLLRLQDGQLLGASHESPARKVAS
ncbi:cyclic peptide export ABC transporter [Corallococcus sp. bb12-1]|uniref:cyclic peptide export ABC transporter n=1 Tax=Corallococcus sp. bb12-1 TaxID=2996784 RepID=UPI00227069DB|nr:cyclic peptide export ABC transporter [Corallococcus sp. bb12-1]MCY1047781.1 cyclic peptide export ABC transporter [Corallococcus sp. bb12-1]